MANQVSSKSHANLVSWNPPLVIKNLHLSFFSISKEDVIRNLPTIAKVAKAVAIALVALVFFKLSLALYLSEPWLWWEPVHFLAHTFAVLSALSTFVSYAGVSPLWDRYVAPWAEMQAKKVK